MLRGAEVVAATAHGRRAAHAERQNLALAPRSMKEARQSRVKVKGTVGLVLSAAQSLRHLLPPPAPTRLAASSGGGAAAGGGPGGDALPLDPAAAALAAQMAADAREKDEAVAEAIADMVDAAWKKMTRGHHLTLRVVQARRRRRRRTSPRSCCRAFVFVCRHCRARGWVSMACPVRLRDVCHGRSRWAVGVKPRVSCRSSFGRRQASGLMKADLFGASDPYAVCWYDGVEVGRTPVCPKTLDPIWPSDKAAFELPPTDTANPELRIEVPSQRRRRTHVWCCHRTDLPLSRRLVHRPHHHRRHHHHHTESPSS